MSFQTSLKLSVASRLMQTCLANSSTDEVPQRWSFCHQICCGFAEPLVSYQ